MIQTIEKYSQTADYILPYEQTNNKTSEQIIIKTSNNRGQLLINNLEIYSMEINNEQWVVARPPIEVRDEDFIIRPRFMIDNHPYRFEFQDDEVFIIRRPDGNVVVFTMKE
jgi:hypothetical protein